MNIRDSIPSNVISLVMIIGFFSICFSPMAHGNQLSQQQADEMVMDRELILEYRYYSDDIIGDDRIPRVRVYQDGFVIVHYPVYMKRAGYHTLTLTSEELQNLVDLIVEEGFFQFNEKDSLEQIAKEKGSSFTYQSHSMQTEVTAYPAIKQVGVTALVHNDLVTVHWKNIEVDIQEYGDSIVGLNGLYRISQRFEQLADRAFKQ